MSSVVTKETPERLGLLIDNALDFLGRSIDDLSSAPKYSVIHFYAAIELFLKARLLAEHWSLVIDRRKSPSKADFDKGQFASVTLEDAAELLENVVGITVPAMHLAAFKRVRSIRNQMVHFYHVETSGKDGGKRMFGIVAAQLEAWYLLHDLLHTWGDVFGPWNDRIGAMDRDLRKFKEYLKAAYNDLRDSIKQETEQGVVFLRCPSCEFPAERHDSNADEIYQSECLVCRFSDMCIHIECPNCGEHEVAFRDSSTSCTCEGCNASFDREALIDRFIDQNAAHSAAVDGDYYPFPVNCGECDGDKTVVELPAGGLLCSSCFDEATSFETCEWCSEESTHLPEETFATGCAFCDGRNIDDD
jgi:hypothetical protein